MRRPAATLADAGHHLLDLSSRSLSSRRRARSLSFSFSRSSRSRAFRSSRSRAFSLWRRSRPRARSRASSRSSRWWWREEDLSRSRSRWWREEDRSRSFSLSRRWCLEEPASSLDPMSAAAAGGGEAWRGGNPRRRCGGAWSCEIFFSSFFFCRVINELLEAVMLGEAEPRVGGGLGHDADSISPSPLVLPNYKQN